MSLHNILAGKELEVVSKEGILENQSVGNRQYNERVLPQRAGSLNRQRIGKRPAKPQPRTRVIDERQKPARRFTALRYAVPAIVFAVVAGIPVGRYIANDAKEQVIRNVVGARADYDNDGIVSYEEREKFYEKVFGENGLEGLSFDEIYSKIQSINQ